MKRADARRRFGLLDGILFVAATALGLGLWLIQLQQDDREMDPAGRMPAGASDWMMFASCLSVAWSFLVVLTYLLPPRRAWKRMITQPGWVASLASVITPLVLMTNEATGLLAYCLNQDEPRDAWNSYHYRLYDWITPTKIAPAVIVAWAVVVVGRRWRFRSELIDWVGLLLGCWWIAAAPLTHLFWNISE